LYLENKSFIFPRKQSILAGVAITTDEPCAHICMYILIQR